MSSGWTLALHVLEQLGNVVLQPELQVEQAIRRVVGRPRRNVQPETFHREAEAMMHDFHAGLLVFLALVQHLEE